MDARASGIFYLSAVEFDNNGFVVNAEDGAVGQDVAVQDTGPGEKNTLLGAVLGESKDAGIHDGRGGRTVCWVEIWEDGVAVDLLHRQWGIVRICLCYVLDVIFTADVQNTRPQRAQRRVNIYIYIYMYIRVPEHIEQHGSSRQFKHKHVIVGGRQTLVRRTRCDSPTGILTPRVHPALTQTGHCTLTRSVRQLVKKSNSQLGHSANTHYQPANQPTSPD